MTTISRIIYSVVFAAVCGAIAMLIIAILVGFGLFDSSVFDVVINMTYSGSIYILEIILMAVGYAIAPIMSKHMPVLGWEHANRSNRDKLKNQAALRQATIVLVGLLFIAINLFLVNS
ncbi:MAG: hypothetical protein JAZ17_00240 [Candidatus Thiodiazotropha endolucinida]|nr:hypothetical protein [Candidatus Thiodiazotropha taylori]MCG8092054.1 hypothetical protein [Candidatus Thiodiazotropha endolucinida]MCW4315627.1 hypothetical protein [Candidatus Thiodiazotropha taylori]